MYRSLFTALAVVLVIGVSAARADLSTVYDYEHIITATPWGTQTIGDSGSNPLLPLHSYANLASFFTSLTVTGDGIYAEFGPDLFDAEWAGSVTFSVERDGLYDLAGSFRNGLLIDTTTDELLYSRVTSRLKQHEYGASTGTLFEGHVYSASWVTGANTQKQTVSSDFGLEVLPIPIPSAILLGAIGLGTAFWVRRWL